jgi:hypothetical protein
MKTLFFVLIVFLFSFGCKAPRIITETVTETKWRDTTIYVKIPVYIDKIVEVPLPVRDTLRIVEKVFVSNGGYATMKPVHKEQGIIGGDISIANGKLIANFYLLDSTILYNYKDTLTFEDSIKIANAIRDTQTSTTNTVIKPPEKYVSKFSKFTHKWFFLTLFLIAIFVTWKIKGAWIKDLLTKIKK